MYISIYIYRETALLCIQSLCHYYNNIREISDGISCSQAAKATVARIANSPDISWPLPLCARNRFAAWAAGFRYHLITTQVEYGCVSVCVFACHTYLHSLNDVVYESRSLYYMTSEATAALSGEYQRLCEKRSQTFFSDCTGICHINYRSTETMPISPPRQVMQCFPTQEKSTPTLRPPPPPSRRRFVQIYLRPHPASGNFGDYKNVLSGLMVKCSVGIYIHIYFVPAREQPL